MHTENYKKKVKTPLEVFVMQVIEDLEEDMSAYQYKQVSKLVFQARLEVYAKKLNSIAKFS